MKRKRVEDLAAGPPRIELAHLPTPLLRLDRLSKELSDAQVWIKRDDLTGLELSGNKVRKLEYVAADAIAAGCDMLITEGTPQSNHCRATAAVCARLGLRAHLLLRPEVEGSPRGNHLLDVLFGATTRSYSREQYAAEHETIVLREMSEARAAGHKPRFTPAGASEPLGCWGYIRAAAELAEQLAAAKIEACDVVVAISSCGTYAGLLLGVLLHKLSHVNVWAVPVSDDVPHHTLEVARLCREMIEQFGLPIDFDAAAMRFIDGYVGEGYAIPYERELAAIRKLAATEAIVLDPVYTGKAFCAFLEAAREGRFGRERPAVFLHTGGIFSNFA